MPSTLASRSYAANPATFSPGTLTELFLTSVDRNQLPNAQMVKREGSWRQISHQEILETVRSLAAALPSLGVRRGDPVGLLSENRPEWAQADYGLLCAGALTVPLYGTLPSNQLAFILKDSGARAVFVSSAQQLAKMEEIRGELPELQTVVVFDQVANLPSNTRQWSEVIQAGAKLSDEQAFRREALEVRPDDVATLIYTSGTTGHPKGVMLTHNNLRSNVEAQAWLAAAGGNDIALSFLPLSHVFERMVDYLFFKHGIPIAYVASFDDVAKALLEVRPTLACAVPRVYEKLYARILSEQGLKRRIVTWAKDVSLAWSEVLLSGDVPGPALKLQHAIADRLVYSKIRTKLGGRLRFFVSGSAPLDPQIAKFFFGAGVLILEGYGLTETSPVTNVNRPDAMRIGTVGKPISGTEVMIAEDGEILVRGPQVMKGYFKRPDATAEAINADGWFHTGDIGDIDADGFLRITDRKKDLIKTAGGKIIAPQPIQNQAKQSRFVSDAVLIGDRRPYPTLLVVPNFQTLESWAAEESIAWGTHAELVADQRVKAKFEEEVRRLLEGFARFEMPKKFVVLEREFDIERGEITPSLKVKRKVVEDHFREQIEAAYDSATSVHAEA